MDPTFYPLGPSRKRCYCSVTKEGPIHIGDCENCGKRLFGCPCRTDFRCFTCGKRVCENCEYGPYSMLAGKCSLCKEFLSKMETL